MLLGLVREGSGVGSDILKNLDVDLKKVRQEVEKLVTHGTTMVIAAQLPFTPDGKKVLEFALNEASMFGHNYIGTEHLLLGLIRARKGIAAKVLRNLKVRLKGVREEALELLGAEVETPSDSSRGGSVVDEVVDEVIQEVAMIERILDLEERVRRLEERLGED